MREMPGGLQDGHPDLETAKQPGMYPVWRLYQGLSGTGDPKRALVSGEKEGGIKFETKK